LLAGAAVLAASVLLLTALLPTERAEGACTAEICMKLDYVTNQEGLYVLVITPLMLEFVLPEELRDCVWDVESQFSDGSPPEHYVFDAAKSFSAAHRFPERGTYLVTVHATNGIQADNGEPCPTIQIDATVLYPDPPPPPPPPPPVEPRAPPAGDPPAPPPQSPATRLAGDGDDAPQGPASSYWRNCGAIQAHAVSCKRARRVVRAARTTLSRARSERLAEGATFRATGFSCRLRQSGPKPLACRLGKRRVRAPL
jgi:hypothetical protein